MNGEREPHANTNKVSEQTLDDLLEVLDNCEWVKREGYEELAPADRAKTNPTLRRLVEEVNLTCMEFYLVHLKCPQTITPRGADVLIPIRLYDPESTLSQRSLRSGELISAIKEEGKICFKGDAVLLCLSPHKE